MTGERLPEPDPAAERGVLAGCFRHGRAAYVEVAPLLSEDCFTDEAYRALWLVAEHVLARQDLSRIDNASFNSAARALGVHALLSGTQERRLVQGIVAMDLELDAVVRHAKVVARLALARGLLRTLRKAEEDLCGVTGQEGPDEILGLAQGPLQEFEKGALSLAPGGAVRMGRDALAYFEAKLASPRKQMGIPTGFPRYDKAIGGGLRPGNIDFITARQGTGKSLFAVNVALNVARQGIPVLYMDTEMMLEEQLDRAAACLSGLPASQVETGNLPPDSHDKLLWAARRLGEMPLDHEEITGLPPQAIISRARRWIRRTVGLRDDGTANPCVLVFDWLKMMDQSSISHNLSEYQAIGFFIDALKDLVKTEKVSCLCFGQQNRDGLDYEDARVVRGGEKIVDTVSTGAIFKRKDDDKVEPGEVPTALRFTHKLFFFKCRHAGLWGKNYINIATDFSRSFLEEGPTRDELFAQQGGHIKGVGNGPVQT